MAIDVRGLTNQYPEWAGLYKMADSLNEKSLRQQTLSAQSANKRGAAGAFLQNYLDPKDYLSGTAFDPMILQGLEDAMQQGAKLAASGADSPTLMMALGPMVNRLNVYSTNAKNINKQVDDYINNMKADKQEGFDWAAVKNEALQKAFFKQDESGKSVLNPDQADPSVNWVMKAIEESPEKVTTPEAFDLYAKNSQINKNLHDITEMDKFGNPTRSKVSLTAQNYLTPEYDKPTGKVKGFVPVHDEATELGQPLYHTFDDGKGGKTKAQVRLLDEKIFDSFRPGQINYIRGQVKKHLQEYEDATGEKISMDSPKAKLVARALAYDELNKPTRKATNVEYVQQDKLSPQQISLNIQSTDKYLQTEREKAAARKQGRLDVEDDRFNAVETIGKVFNGELQGETVPKYGKNVIDITNYMPGGGLKAGRGVDYDFKGIYFDPQDRTLVVEKEATDRFSFKKITPETIPEKNIGQFINNIAMANGVEYTSVRKLLDNMGYKDGRFTKAKDITPQLDFEKKMKSKSWRDSYPKNPFQPLNK
jgi:hypothetical protein